MLIPLGTDRPLRRPTAATHALIAANVLVFATMTLMYHMDEGAFEAINPHLVLDPRQIRPWAFITYAFVHDHTGFLHILGNMLFLWVFGPNVEDRFGRLGFLAFYLVAGALAGAVHVLTSANPVVGASGAVSGVTGAYLVLFPRTHIKTLLWFFIIGIFQIPALWFIGFAIARDFFWFGLHGSMGVSDGVARAAHLGGYAFGFGVAFVLLATRVLSREGFDLFSIARQARRRRVIKEAVHQTDRARPARASAPVSDAKAAGIAGRRAAIANLAADQDLAGAGEEYRRLIRDAAGTSHPTLLSRRTQLDVANHLFQTGDHALAAVAYTAFLEGYRADAERGTVKLMLGLIQMRYLGQREAGLRNVNEARPLLRDPDQAALADDLLREAAPPPLKG